MSWIKLFEFMRRPTVAAIPQEVSAREINALPPRIRKYIHDLETRCDHSGDLRRLAQQADLIRELSASNRMLRDWPSRLTQEDRQTALGWAGWCERRGMGGIEAFLRRIAS